MTCPPLFRPRFMLLAGSRLLALALAGVLAAGPGRAQSPVRPTQLWGRQGRLGFYDDELNYVDENLQRVARWQIPCAQGYTLLGDYGNGRFAGHVELYDSLGRLRLTVFLWGLSPPGTYLSNSLRVYAAGRPGTPGPVLLDLDTYRSQLNGAARLFDAQGRERLSAYFRAGQAEGPARLAGPGPYPLATFTFTQGGVEDFELWDAAGHCPYWCKRQELYRQPTLYYLGALDQPTKQEVLADYRARVGRYRHRLVQELAAAVAQANRLLRLVPADVPGLAPIVPLPPHVGIREQD